MKRATFLLKAFLMLSLFGISSGSRAQRANLGSQENVATVHIMLVNWYGKDLQGSAQIEAFTSLSDKRDYSKLFHNGTVHGIPYGIYDVRARTPGFWPANRTIRVFQPNVWAALSVEIGLAEDEGGLQRFRLSGHIENFEPSQESTWVHLLGVYSGTVMSTVTDSSGAFVLDGIPQGSYIAVVTRNGRNLGISAVDIPLKPGASLTVEVPKRP